MVTKNSKNKLTSTMFTFEPFEYPINIKKKGDWFVFK